MATSAQIRCFKRKSRSNSSKVVSKYVLQMVRDVESSCFEKTFLGKKELYVDVKDHLNQNHFLPDFNAEHHNYRNNTTCVHPTTMTSHKMAALLQLKGRPSHAANLRYGLLINRRMPKHGIR